MTIKGCSVDRVKLIGVAAASAMAGCSTHPASPSTGVHVAGSDLIRVGVVGCGSRGRGAATQAVQSSPNVRITALADLFPEPIDHALAVWKDRPRSLYDLSRDRCFIGWDACRQLMQSDVDYVILCTPPAFRPMHLRAAVEAGKHAYLEKAVAVDPVGIRSIIESGEIAQKKNLAIVAGTWRRHDLGYLETIQRIRDGAIGQIVAAVVHFLHSGFPATARQPHWSDMEWQIRNFPFFTWLSGDFIVEHHVHQHDIVNWVLGQTPKHVIATGGRQARTLEIYGNIYDHFAADYEYEGGVRMHSYCRQNDNTSLRVSELLIGTKGQADPAGKILALGKDPWKYKGPPGNAWLKLHADLISSIRAGAPINEARETAHSHLTSIMGRMSAYTGQLIRWSDAMNSPLDLLPRPLAFGPLPISPVPVPGRKP